MKTFKDKLFLSMVLLIGCACLVAAKPTGITKFTSLWIGDSTQTADVTPGANDLYVYGTSEFDGAARFDGGITDTTGGVTAGEIADVTREIFFPVAGWAVDGSNDIDDATAPDLSTVDNVPAIVYANSAETTCIQQTFRLPSGYVSGLTLYVLVSSDTAAPASVGGDWLIWDNANNVGFDSAAIAQDAVYATSSTLDASCEVLTLTMDATGEAAMAAGHFYTIELFNATSDVSANLEIKGVTGTYAATQ